LSHSSHRALPDPPPDPPPLLVGAEGREVALRAGAAAGLAGFAVFLILHAVLIVPIWHVAPIGALLAAVGGGAVALACTEVLRGVRRGWILALAVFAATWLALAPGLVLGELGIRAGQVAALEGTLGFLGPIVGLAALAGGMATRTRRGTGTCAGAAFLLAVGPGHNIPFLAGTPAVATELAMLVAVFGSASVVLGVVGLGRPPERAACGDLERGG
jgi:hypothetical protein